MSDSQFYYPGGADGNMGLPDPSTIYNNNDGSDPAGSIVSGSFGNNGGSVGDNGAGGGSGEEPGNAGASGAPTQADYSNLVKQFGPTAANQIMQQVVKANPGWAGQISQFVPNLTSPTGGTSGGNTTGSILPQTNLSMLLPALATAYQQYNNANQYTQQAEKYAGVLNPYGAYRDAAAQKLAALQADPSSIVNTPGYQFSLSQGLGAVANRDNRSFGVGAGSTNPDMMSFASGLASKTYNDTINQYSNQAGVNIGPQSAAAILQTGMQGNIAGQSNAINAMLSPFGPGNNTGNATPVSGLPNLFNGAVPGYTYNPATDPGNITNNQQVPSVPPTDLYPTVPNNNTGVIPGGT